jgi:hypothetical protein
VDLRERRACEGALAARQVLRDFKVIEIRFDEEFSAPASTVTLNIRNRVIHCLFSPKP